MKKLNIVSFIVAAISFLGFALWRFGIVAFPDWLVRVVGILMLCSVFTVVFSTVKVKMVKK